jgi:homoserine kinase type II
MSVYTTIEQHELEAFLGHYPVDVLDSFAGISDGIENTNYFVDCKDGARFVLTIFEHHSFDEMQYFLNLMHHLAAHGVPSANPVADNDGQYLRMLKDKPAALVERLKGGSIRDTTPAHCAQIGAALGKLHSAGMSFDASLPNPRGPHWCKQTADQVLSKLPEQDRALLNEEIVFQRGKRAADIPRGVIHADLFRDNALWANDKLSGIIDFYYACNDVLLYDLAVTVNDWCCDTDYSLNQHKVTTLLQQYHTQRPLTEAEQSFWPAMLRAAALRFWLSRLYDKHFPRPGELVHTKDPDEFRAIMMDRVTQQDTYQSYWL